MQRQRLCWRVRRVRFRGSMVRHWVSGLCRLHRQLLAMGPVLGPLDQRLLLEATRGSSSPAPFLRTSNPREIENAFDSLAETRPDALLVGPGPFFR
jgi:hypothetical protein